MSTSKEGVAVEAKSQATVFVAVCLFCITCILFAPVGRFDFINYDDDQYVLENYQLQQGFTAETLQYFFSSAYHSLWAPLTWYSHTLDYQIFGDHAGGHHFVNLLLHALNTVLLFLWLRSATQKLFLSAVVAGLFAWHPLHVESVAWIASRKDLLCGLFFFLALHAYHRYVTGKGLRYFFLVMVAYLLGLMAKPMMITLPVILLLLDFWPYQRFALTEAGLSWKKRLQEKALLEKIPFLPLMIFFAGLTIVAQERALAPMATLPIGLRLANAATAYGKYMIKTLYPSPLAVPYYLDARNISYVAGLLAAIALLGLGLLLWRKRSQLPFALMGFLWFLILLLPAIGIIQVGHQSMADRHSYLPLIGLSIALVWLGDKIQLPAIRPLLMVGAALVLAACCALTSRQLQYWKDSATLFEHSAAVTQNNFVAHHNLGNHYMGLGDFEKARLNFEKAVAIKGDSLDTQTNLGVACLQLGDFQEAIKHFLKVLQRNPNDAEVWVNLGAAYYSVGDMEQAAHCARQALAIQPLFPKADQLEAMARMKQ